MLDEMRAHELCQLYFRGVRGDDLFIWKGKDKVDLFEEEHLKALTHLIVKGKEIEAAIRHISGLTKYEAKDIYSDTANLPNFSTDKASFFSSKLAPTQAKVKDADIDQLKVDKSNE